MPAIKPLEYTPKQVSLALLGRAISHPCRVKIVELLIKAPQLSNKELSDHLSLSKAAIHDHIMKLWDADLISLTYFPHSTCIEISKEQIKKYRKLESLFKFTRKKAYHLGLVH
jgi:predicted transcriptional regulator